MTNDAGSGFDNQAAARDAGQEHLIEEEESRHLPDEDADAGPLEEDYERKQGEDKLNEAF